METSMNPPVWRHYDQAALEREYDNRAKVSVSELQDYRARWSAESEKARSTCRLAADVPYGPSELERLDVYGHVSDQPKPIHVYIHGGYWHFGDKHDSAYVALPFEHDAITVVLNYGLAPATPIGEQVEQCRAAIAWIWHHASRYGGDPARIYVTGHSAGGHLAAMLGTTDWSGVDERFPRDMIKGLVLLSGLYDLAPVALLDVNRTLGLSAGDVSVLSPARLACRDVAKVVVAVGDLEGPEYIEQSRLLANAWAAQVPLELSIQERADHFSIRSGWCEPHNEVVTLQRALMGL
jgi:arylformamidase